MSFFGLSLRMDFLVDGAVENKKACFFECLHWHFAEFPRKHETSFWGPGLPSLNQCVELFCFVWLVRQLVTVSLLQQIQSLPFFFSPGFSIKLRLEIAQDIDQRADITPHRRSRYISFFEIPHPALISHNLAYSLAFVEVWGVPRKARPSILLFSAAFFAQHPMTSSSMRQVDLRCENATWSDFFRIPTMPSKRPRCVVCRCDMCKRLWRPWRSTRKWFDS